jgi:diaminohydroxyphosphoribosylaminopyrimidine deaminase / 5-amino-6-(5-phosphoribosylamino)uracil reductase
MEMDEFYMQRCIDLARIGEGNVAPNPMVGAVIVCDGKVIGEGFHQKYGEAHAEVNAVNSVVDKSLLSKSTIYVSLEPCAHFGKTPPCADLMVKFNFKRVVIGCYDSYSEVSGKGVQKIKDAGIECEIGILENECKELNKRFFTFHDKKRPYVILKWAQTKDGFFDVIRDDCEKGVNWISSSETKVLVHKWRSVEQSILVGKNTVLIDNPSLTVREIAGVNPIRIVLDSQCSISQNANVLNLESETLVFNLVKNEKNENATWIQLEDMKIESIVKKLYDLQIQSVFVEGGAAILQAFIDANLWDEAKVIVGDTTFNEGIKAPVLPKTPFSNFRFFTDQIYNYKNI